MRKNKKIYVIIALVAVVGLLLSSMIGLFEGLLQGNDVAEPNPYQEMLSSYVHAANELEQQIEENPEDMAIFEQLADVYFVLGELSYYMQNPVDGDMYFGKAAEKYQDVLNEDESNHDLRIRMATAAFYSGNLGTAEEEYMEVMSRDPHHPEPYFYYGIVQYEQEDYEAAIESWEALMDLEKDFDPAQYETVDEVIFRTAAAYLEQVRMQLEEGNEEE